MKNETPDEHRDRMRLLRLQNSRWGERCAIVCNGWSVPERDKLLRIRKAGVPVIGVNTIGIAIEPGAPWLECDYYVLVDIKAIAAYGDKLPPMKWIFSRQRMAKQDPIVLGSAPDGIGYSFDIAKGVVFNGAGSVALQVATFLGFHRVVFVGLDLANNPKTGFAHYYTERRDLHLKYDRQTAEHLFRGQREFMIRADKMIRDHFPFLEIVTTSPSGKTAFERVSFDAEFPG